MAPPTGQPTTAREAREAARRWVGEHGTGHDGFRGAFLTGSALWAADDTPLCPDSDVDVMVVLDTAAPLPFARTFAFGGVLLEVSHLPETALATPERVLADPHLAGSLARPSVLADPTGRLTETHRAVARAFTEPRWVAARWAAAADTVRRWIGRMEPSMPEPDHVTAWLFGAGVMTHVLLVAACRNPTVKRRYAAVRELLDRHDRLDYHERLLALLGSARLTRAQVRRHHDAVAAAFDAAALHRVPSYRFDSAITDMARPIALDSTRRLIDGGLHREAVFWLLATYCRCLTKLTGAGVDTTPHEAPFHHLLADLGVPTAAAREEAGQRVLAELPALRRLAQEIARTN